MSRDKTNKQTKPRLGWGRTRLLCQDTTTPHGRGQYLVAEGSPWVGFPLDIQPVVEHYGRVLLLLEGHDDLKKKTLKLKFLRLLYSFVDRLSQLFNVSLYDTPVQSW